jgi:hypothetical protein
VARDLPLPKTIDGMILTSMCRNAKAAAGGYDGFGLTQLGGACRKNASRLGVCASDGMCAPETASVGSHKAEGKE